MTAATIVAAQADRDHDTYAMPDLPRLAPTTPTPPHADPTPRRRSGQWDGQPGVAYGLCGRTGVEVSHLPAPYTQGVPMNIDLLLEKAKPWATPCGSCDYGMPMGCTCPDGDPRPVMSRLVAEIERLRNAQGWDPSSPQWAVIRAAIAWRKAVDDVNAEPRPLEDALVEAVDALDAGAGSR